MDRKKDEYREIKALIEKLTHSGNDSLKASQLKIVKSICSTSEKDVEVVYGELMKLLEKKHSEVRFSAVQLCDELFMCNNTFRTHLSANMLGFLKYTIDEPLPPPKAAAKKLLKLAISCIDKWYSKFGRSVNKLEATYNYLRKRKNVDFETKEIIDPKKRMEQKENERKAMLLNKQYLQKTTSEMEEMKLEIEATITSLESCFTLLLPSPEEFNADNPESTQVHDSPDFDMRLFGVVDPRHSVQIEFNKDEQIEIKETEENSDLLGAAKDGFTLINNRFLPKTNAWIELLSKVNDTSDRGVLIMKSAVKQKVRLEQLVRKYNLLKIIQHQDQAEEVSSDSDLEEVTLPKVDKVIRQHEEIGFLSDLLVDRSKDDSENTTDETHSKSEKVSDEQMSDRKKQLLKVAPKLPYDIDLYHWEDEKLPTPTVVAVNCEGAKFWSGGISEDISELPLPGGSSTLRTRVIEFSGKFEPVERACRAPLSSGKLCPRKDRIKCPFHGLIVDRNDKGCIVNEEYKKKVFASTTKPVTPDWQDPKLLAEIKAATGVDLKMPEKGKRKKKVKFPGLTDLNASKKTPKARISKKIFNRRSMNRVAAAMNNLEHKRHKDKFGDQFNYVHGTS